jgi:hypothetical protein
LVVFHKIFVTNSKSAWEIKEKDRKREEGMGAREGGREGGREGRQELDVPEKSENMAESMRRNNMRRWPNFSSTSSNTSSMSIVSDAWVYKEREGGREGGREGE